MSGKDVDSVNGISRYLTKYQVIKKMVKFILSGRSGRIVEYHGV